MPFLQVQKAIHNHFQTFENTCSGFVKELISILEPLPVSGQHSKFNKRRRKKVGLNRKSNHQLIPSKLDLLFADAKIKPRY